jgi:hypothetical protein
MNKIKTIIKMIAKYAPIAAAVIAAYKAIQANKRP